MAACLHRRRSYNCIGYCLLCTFPKGRLRRIEKATLGGDSCWFEAELQTLNSEGFKFMAFNRSKSPIYDVYLLIRSHVDDPAYATKEPQQIEIGSIPAHSVKETNFRLPFGYYEIDIRTRNNKYYRKWLLPLAPVT
jgi:hypothetical protein